MAPLTHVKKDGITWPMDGAVMDNLECSDSIVHSGDTNTKIRFPAADTFTVETAGSERFRIDDSGRIGIGTNSPSSFSSGADDFVLNTSSGNCGLTLSTSAADQDNNIFFAEGTGANAVGRIKYAHADNSLQFFTGSTERLKIDANGSVHIDGATSANHGLRFTPNGWNGYDNRMGVCGSSGADFWWSSNWNPTDGARDHNGYGTNFIRQNVDTGYIAFGTGPVDTTASERLRIANDGKIGIGTASPQVSGIHIHQTNARLQLTDGTTGSASGDGIIFGLNGSQDFFINNRESSKNVLFFTENTERLRIQSGGGISFNGDTAAANGLSDYEEGTWTPAFASSGDGSWSYANQLGIYTKIGRMVYINGLIQGTISGSESGNTQITGLPFTCNNESRSYGQFVTTDHGNFESYPTGFLGLGGYVSKNSTTIHLMWWRTGTSDGFPTSRMGTNTYIYFSTRYET